MKKQLSIYAAVVLISASLMSCSNINIVQDETEISTAKTVIETVGENEPDSPNEVITEENFTDKDSLQAEIHGNDIANSDSDAKETENTEENTDDSLTEEEITESRTETDVSQEVLSVSTELEVDPTIQGTMYSITVLNVRSGPSTDYEKIGQLSFGQAVEVTGQADTGWYQISYNGETGYVSNQYLSSEYPTATSGSIASSGNSHVISDFQIIYQNPELPTGCESVALTMLVNYYGVYADKLDMADNYLPKQDNTFYYDESGRKIGPDMENYFVGDPRGVGHICGVPAIMTEADTWLEAQGSDLRSVDLTGISFEELYAYIDDDTPVMVWVTIYMADRRTTQGWYTEDGRWMEYATNDHGAVLIGYSDTTVTIADPISGIVEYSRAQFEKVFASRGSQAIILQ